MNTQKITSELKKNIVFLLTEAYKDYQEGTESEGYFRGHKDAYKYLVSREDWHEIFAAFCEAKKAI